MEKRVVTPRRVVLMVLDGLGVGELPDAPLYGDTGSNTLVNTARAVGGLHVPHLQRLGLGNIVDVPGVTPVAQPLGAYGRMAEQSAGKDSTTGHWELAGYIVQRAFPTYPDGFPSEVLDRFTAAVGRGVLGNKAASGTAIIAELGDEHVRTGKLIVYTSADSVFQIAAHEAVVPPEELYDICMRARELLTGDHGVGRVIARPFAGESGAYQRTPRRKDFSLEPPEPTVLDALQNAGHDVITVGKVRELFAGRGISKAINAATNMETVDGTLQALRRNPATALIFANCVEFDSVWGHRNDPQGYAGALQEFDARVPELTDALDENDICLLVGDHGTDPTTPGTDHTREYVPLLVWGPDVVSGISLGTRETFADVAATVADLFGVSFAGPGRSFASALQVSGPGG